MQLLMAITSLLFGYRIEKYMDIIWVGALFGSGVTSVKQGSYDELYSYARKENSGDEYIHMINFSEANIWYVQRLYCYIVCFYGGVWIGLESRSRERKQDKFVMHDVALFPTSDEFQLEDFSAAHPSCPVCRFKSSQSLLFDWWSHVHQPRWAALHKAILSLHIHCVGACNTVSMCRRLLLCSPPRYN